MNEDAEYLPKLTNHFRYRRIGSGYLVTAEHGSWMMLDEKAFKQLGSGKISDEKLSKELEEKGFLVTKDNKEMIKREYAKRYSYLRQGTSLHIVVVTLRCNQSCIYCQASSRPEKKDGYDMDENTAKNVVDFIFQTQSSNICIEFQGGEPLLNFDIVRFITEYANKVNETKKKKLTMTMVTNMTLMTDEILEYCISNRIFLCTSLDGTKDLHDRNRGFRTSSHDLVTGWISRIQDEYKKRDIEYTTINALITVTKDTLKHPREIVDEYRRLGLKTMHLRFLSRLGYANRNKARIEYEAEEFIEFWKAALEYMLELNRSGEHFTERTVITILRKILTGTDPNYLDMRSPCGAVIGQMAYNYNGDIFSCDEGRMLEEDTFRLGNVKTHSYNDVVCSPESCAIVSASINDSYICESCAYKPYCGVCPVCNFAEQGTTIGIIPQTTFCKVYKAQFDYVFEKYSTDPETKKIFDEWLENCRNVPVS